MSEPHQSAAEIFASWASGLSAGDVPGGVRTILESVIIDQIGLCVVARDADFVRSVLASTDTQGACTVIGQGRTLDPAGAAFVNGTAAHGEDFDDTFEGTPVHCGSVVAPAVLAACEARRRNGGDALRGIAAGIELMCRLALVAPTAVHRAGFHPTAVIGALGAAAGVSVALGLDAARVASAIGIAGSFASGLIEYLAEGAWTKRFHAGWAAQSCSNVARSSGLPSAASFKLMAPEAVDRYVESMDHLQRFYKAAIDAGVPYQDARYVVPEGTQTSITATYNLLALIGTVRRRICNRMQWEVNYVARRMADLTVAALPWVGKALRSGCEARGVCQTIDPMFAPSCLWSEGDMTDWCADSPALIELMDGANYNWQRWTNGSLKFYNTDMARLTKEGAHPNTTWTLSYRDTTQPLSYKTQEGLWKKATK